jgi:hypothetical protein
MLFILCAFALVLFLLAAFLVAAEPARGKLVCIGLACLAAAACLMALSTHLAGLHGVL